MMRIFALLAAGLIAACSPQGAAETQATSAVAADAASPDVHPVSGLEVVPLTVTGRSGTHKFEVEVARTAQEQARGLMFRTELGPNEGMIFPYKDARQLGFWMKDTPLPLDIIFIGVDGRINNIAAMTTPYSTESVYSTGFANLVLEIPGGRAAELGIQPGDLVEY